MEIKHIVGFFLIGIMFNINCQAQQVTKKEAVRAAINTIRYESIGNADGTVDTVYTKTTEKDTLMYEVVFDDGSVVILSGNKSCVPILGLITDPNSRSNTDGINSIFADGDNVPDGLSFLLDEYAQQIAYCFSHNLTGSHSMLWQHLQEYDSAFLNNRLKVGPLLTTEWGQAESNDKGYYQPDYCAYNAFVTVDHCYHSLCNKCPAGCVAVAMGQIMKYWGHPDENPRQNLHFDWNNMPSALIRHDNSNYNNEKNAIAALLRNCGEQANMTYCSNYYPCGSSASPDTACLALRGYGYSDAILLRRSDCSDWILRMINEINNGDPLFYCGWNNEGSEAHAFVCDGYKTVIGGYQFHFNWGWNGGKDGWFTLDNLTPGNHNYSYDHCAIFNLYPTACFSSIIRECDTVFLNGTIKEYAVKEGIRNNGHAYVISNNASIHLQAGDEILLSNGFYAAIGSDFQATISPCSSVATSDPNHLSGVTFGDNATDTLPAPKSLQTETSSADDAALTVYPNPTDNLLYIELSGGEIANVALYDLQGRMMSGVHAGTPQQGATATMNMHNVPAGIYLLRVMDADGKEYHRKIVKR